MTSEGVLMKKFLIAAAAVLMLSGCKGSDEQAVFSVTDEQTRTYKDIIEARLTENGWSYNPDTIEFSALTLPSKDDAFYDDMDKVVSDGAAKVGALINKKAVQAKVELKHINGDNLGSAYFYFNGNKEVCGYYKYNNKYYTLDSKNPFENGDVFTKYENITLKRNFEPQSAEYPFNSAYAVRGGITAAVADDNTVYYYDGTKNFKVTSRVDNTGKGLLPIDITLGDDFGTILLGEKADIQQAEDENEVSDIVSEPPLRSSRIEITTPKGKPAGVTIPTTVSNYSSVAQEGNKIFFTRDKSIDEYVYKDESLGKAKTYTFEHYVSDLCIADIDGNGTDEFIISDGTNIYVYKKSSKFDLIWRSNAYLNSLSGKIYTGDMNGDGVKELFVTDSIGVTARYILTEQGFKICGGGIVYGSDDIYIIADFNNDGTDDYMTMSDDKKLRSYYIGK